MSHDETHCFMFGNLRFSLRRSITKYFYSFTGGYSWYILLVPNTRHTFSYESLLNLFP